MRLIFITMLSTLAACAGEEPQRARILPGDNGTVLFEGGDTGKECNAANRTQACSCGALAGRQVCTPQLAWGACECLDPMTGGAAGMGGSDLSGNGRDPAANKLAASFAWLRTDPGSSA